jgi:2-oxoglutarate ferredoxin oxidoreductase subunit beta
MHIKSLKYYKDKYIRNQPFAFCVGCGNGIILNSFVRALDDLEISNDKVLAVSGIGCSSWIPSPYFNGDTLHTTHGRAIAFATGAKIYNRKLETVVFTGDGDGAGIGGNHLIHAARRNIDMTTILVNNMSYAMTGGQIAPSTRYGEKTVSSPFGNPENPFKIAELVAKAGATYVARWTTFHIMELVRSIKEALQHKGYSFIEVLSQCPTQQRPMFGMRDPVHRIPSRILEMFSESTYIKGITEKNNYRYALPTASPENTLISISKNLYGKGSTRIVDHLTFGNVIRIDPKHEIDWNSLLRLKSVERIVGPKEGKIELGVLVQEKRQEFTESLLSLIQESGR